MSKVVILVLAAVFSVFLSGLFSGAETGVYQMSRLRLRLGIERKRPLFVILGRSLRDGQGLLISILAGTNLSNYLATSIVTYLLLSRLETGHSAEFLAAFITAPILFVFSELIPKSIFFYRCDSLMPLVGPVLFSFHKLFSWCGVVAVLKRLSRLFGSLAGVPIPSRTVVSPVYEHQITAILKDTNEEDLLSSVQTDMISRLAMLSGMQLSKVMVPISRVRMAEAGCDNKALLKILGECVFTRLPVYERQVLNVIGFINIYDCLGSKKDFAGLQDFIKPIRRLSAQTTVSEAINVMQVEKQRIVLVVRTGHLAWERPVGIVTMKDLVEQLLGELTEW